MTTGSNTARQAAIMTRLNAARQSLGKSISDVTPEIASRGSEWSVGDLLAHLSETYYQDMAAKILSEEQPIFDSHDSDTEWKREQEQALSCIDDVIDIVNRLTPEDMDRSGKMNGQPLMVLDALELSVAHFEEHLAQLKDEVRPREGLTAV